MSGGAKEVIGQVEHAGLLQVGLKFLEVPRPQNAGVFLDFIEVWKHRVLADLVTDDGEFNSLHSSVVVRLRSGSAVVDVPMVMLAERTARFAADTVRLENTRAVVTAGHHGRPKVILRSRHRFEDEIVRAVGVKVARVFLAETLHDRCHDFRIAAEFVAKREHAERRVVSEFPKDADSLGDQKSDAPGHDRFVAAAFEFDIPHRVHIADADRLPQRQLRLHVDSQLVGGLECRLGRAPTVEPVMVDPIRF